MKSIGRIHLDVAKKWYINDTEQFLLSTCTNTPNYLATYPYLDALTYKEFEAKTDVFKHHEFCKSLTYLFTFQNLFDKKHYDFIKPLIEDGNVYVPKKIAPLVIKNDHLFAALTPKQNIIGDLCFRKNYKLFTGCTDKDFIEEMNKVYCSECKKVFHISEAEFTKSFKNKEKILCEDCKKKEEQ